MKRVGLGVRRWRNLRFFVGGGVLFCELGGRGGEEKEEIRNEAGGEGAKESAGESNIPYAA